MELQGGLNGHPEEPKRLSDVWETNPIATVEGRPGSAQGKDTGYPMRDIPTQRHTVIQAEKHLSGTCGQNFHHHLITC